jgi:hypothetical protein
MENTKERVKAMNWLDGLFCLIDNTPTPNERKSDMNLLDTLTPNGFKPPPTKNLLKNIKLLDAGRTNIPNEVRNEISEEMWPDEELGNDTSFVRWRWNLEDKYPKTAAFLREQGIDEDSEETVHIHWSW